MATLLEWALNLMVLNVSTRSTTARSVCPSRGDGTSKGHPGLCGAVTQEDARSGSLGSLGTRPASHPDRRSACGDHVLMAAIGVDATAKHVLAVEGATENTVVVQALIDNLLARGLDPTLPRLFIVDGAKALSKAIRVAAAIQRCQVHKGRNIVEACPNICTRGQEALRQAWDQDDANMGPSGSCATWPGVWSMRNRGLGQHPGGAQEILTVICLGLPHELRRSLACIQHRRERARHGAQVTRNQTLESPRWRSDRRRPAGGPENLPSPQGLSPSAHPPKCSRNT